MMDKELIKRAAEAAGMRHVGVFIHHYLQCQDEDGSYYLWNPLVSDKDAFRLAATLRINISFAELMLMADGVVIREEGPMKNLTILEAARRAVVLAAASIQDQRVN